ncbi:MAG: 2-oxoglutarate dehydrogenase complex dihydrolipoyllysine-residue succinyltransferase [Gemmatimonadetes bacterium]|nr:2-oxoglutarate dehydrogenase complex dihydrolipoyllysine-residue succinyltransferase [Gemmatimonadota bacterium]
MDIKVPQLAESVTEGDIGTWLKSDGDHVEKDEMIVELETDKATVEIAAEASGTLKILVEEGDIVSVGDVIGRIVEEGEEEAGEEEAGEEEEAAEEEAAPEEEEAPPEEAAAEEEEEEEEEEEKAPPAEVQERREEEEEAARERVRREKVRPAREEERPPAEGEAEEPGVRREKMTRLRRRIAERLVEAQRTAAILTTFNEIHMGPVMELREEHRAEFEERHGVRLGFMSFFARASILSLREFPEINAFIEGEEIVYHDRVHLGVAVGTPRGLVVPVLREADRMSFAEMERTIRDLAIKARDGDLSIEDLQGGTFTISNGGVYGSLMSTPILNPPQSGILGMHKIESRAVVLEENGRERIVSRPMMYVALSYDHRIVDGEQAVTFLVRVKERLEDPTRMLLDG